MLDTVLTWSFLAALLASGIRMAMPLVYAGLGEMVSERSGVLNIGMEGVMLCGAFFAFAGTYFTDSLLLGMLAGMLGGALISMLHALVSVCGKQNQTVSGLAMNMLALGLTSYLYRLMFGGGEHLQVRVMPKADIPLLSDIPVIGEAFFSHDILAYIGFLLTIVFFVLIRYTRLGLNTTAIGDNPMAADTAGVHVERRQLIASFVSGLLGGAGGAYMTIAQLGLFNDNLTAGRGYIALAAVILGRYSPVGVFLAALLFGIANALEIRIQALGVQIPTQALAMLPYVITLLALLLTSGRNKAPEALAKPYIRGSRR